MDMMKTAQSTLGDVCTYVRHEGKHTLYTFNCASGVSTIETLQRIEKLGGWAYLNVGERGGPSSAVLDDNDGLDQVKAWEDTQDYVNGFSEQWV